MLLATPAKRRQSIFKPIYTEYQVFFTLKKTYLSENNTPRFFLKEGNFDGEKEVRVVLVCSPESVPRQSLFWGHS